MKNLCLFLCFLVHYTLLGQINFEHTYTDGRANRVNLANSGEKYYLLDIPHSQVKIYNSNHTLWKSINISIPIGALVDELSISENKVNADNLVEVIYTVSNSSTGFKEGYIVNELGTTLLSVPDASALFLNEVAGLPNKIIAHISRFQMTSNVYEMNSLTLANTYVDGHVNRVSLTSSGEKYYLFASQSSQIKIYNSDHTFWKSINLTLPLNARMEFYSISENKINSDNLVEATYVFFTQSSGPRTYEGGIVNELEVTLLSVPNATSIYLDEISNLPNKIIADLYVGNQVISKVYDLPTLTLENTYMEGAIRRINLPSFGEKYYLFSAQNIQAKIYSSNHAFWKGINLYLPTGASIGIEGVSSVSENKINSDTLLEVGYSIVFYYGILGLLDEYESYIINELGTTHLSIPNAYSITIDEIPNIQNKIIATIVDSTYYRSSEVYGLPTTSIAIQKVKASISLEIYPNPTQDYLSINKGKFDIKEAVLVSLDGKLIQHIELSDENTRINLRALQSGIYFITGEDKNGKTFCEKIIKE